MVRKLKSDFTFGFELEGVVNTNVNTRDDLFTLLNENFGDCGDMHYDGSIRYNRYNSETSFEYSSPIFNYTPSNIVKVLKCLDKLPTFGVSVNRSCGFHTHISFDGITQEDTVWFIFWLCASGKFENFRKLGRTNLYGARYAQFNFLDRIANNIKGYAKSGASYIRLESILYEICTNEKYRAIRIHPQGTIEWRGPRTFLNTPTHKKTLSFFKKLDEFIDCFIESMQVDSVTVDGTVFEKKDILSKCNTYLKSMTFRTITKTSLLEKIVNTPAILDKMKLKELDKNRDIIINALDRYYWSTTSFTSKTLFKWFTDNGLNKYKAKFFDSSMLLGDAENLYRNSQLLSTLKEFTNKSYALNEQIYEKLKEWHKAGLYSNTIGMYLNWILSREQSTDYPDLFVDVIKSGLIETMSTADKLRISKHYESMYNSRSTMYCESTFTVGMRLKIVHDTMKEHGLI